MRILFVVTAAEFGGAPIHVLQLVRHITQQGHEVALVAAAEPELIRRVNSLDARVFLNPHFVRPAKPLTDIQALKPVIQAVRSFDPDLVHAHSTKAGFAARFAGALMRKPVIFTAHGWAFTEGRSLWKRRLLALAERMAARVTAKIICVSEHDRQLAIRWKVAKPEQLVVIYNGVEPQPFLEVDRSYVREKLCVGRSVVLTFVGRLAPQKDPFTLLMALKALPEGLLLIVGDGELRSQVERFLQGQDLQDRVRLLGQRSDIPQILAGSDIFILSSKWEGFPYAIIEAMMAGLPVVATRVGGVEEMVENRKTGYLVPANDPLALTKAIQRLLEEPELRKKMGQAGREKALRTFTLDRMLTQTQKVYEEVLDEGMRL